LASKATQRQRTQTPAGTPTPRRAARRWDCALRETSVRARAFTIVKGARANAAIQPFLNFEVSFFELCLFFFSFLH
jgi:hypothetical protein